MSNETEWSNAKHKYHLDSPPTTLGVKCKLLYLSPPFPEHILVCRLHQPGCDLVENQGLDKGN